MAGFRRAFLLNSVERYLCLLISFLTVSIVSRLLSPSEIGFSVIGTGIMTVALSLREFVTPEFLIQRHEVTKEDARTSLTILFLLYGVIAAVLLGATSWIATFYGADRLAPFLRIVILAGLVETCSMPITALLRRDMAFGTLAIITVATTIVSGAMTTALAALGFGFMSFAWAWLAAATTTAVLTLAFRPVWWIFRPALCCWRSALNFGGYSGATTVLGRLYEALPQLMLGGILSASAAGLYNRASVICGLPDRLTLSGVFSVAFPALAAEVRSGHDLAPSYLRALGYITVAYWPALLLLTVLAHPMVLLLLGAAWLDTVPLVQIMCVASLLWFPVIMTFPVLAAIGAFRDNFLAKFICVAVCGLVLIGASFFGVRAMAESQFLTSPFQMAVSLYFVRRHVPFEWGDLLAALWKSAMVTACTMAGPLAIFAATGFHVALTPAQALSVLGSAALGWFGGLRLMRHPFLAEVLKVAERVARRSRSDAEVAVVPQPDHPTD